MTVDSNTLSNLIEYGLTDNEARIYTYLLEHTTSSVFDIAQSTNIARTTVYATLEKLKRSGLVTDFRQNRVLYYSPANPHKLELLLNQKQTALAQALPALQTIIDSTSIRPRMELYTGKEGVKTVLEDVLSTCKRQGIRDLYSSSHPELIDALPHYFPEWIRRREKLGVFTKLIIPHSMHHRTEFYSGHYRETRFLPPNFPFNCTMQIYGDKTCFHSFNDGELYAMIVESPSITAMFKQFFLFTWEMLGKRD